MPEISRFYGLKITMNFSSSEHNVPHIHVVYGKKKGSINILTNKMIVGNLSSHSLHLVNEWVTLHQEELIKMWNTQEFKKIKGLE